MDRAVKRDPPENRSTLLGGDWIEWLVVVLLALIAAVGVALITGSPLFGTAVGTVLLISASVVVACL